jgi:hypothetical protein
LAALYCRRPRQGVHSATLVMPNFNSNEEFFTAFRDLVERIERKGHVEAARELQTGLSCLNGLTDGWALLMEAIDRVSAVNRDGIGKPEMAELRDLRRVVSKVVYRR